ncbi:MAG: histidine kinase [Aquificae bacterium]|nr:histidine kinase [Aquificota bacterium]
MLTKISTDILKETLESIEEPVIVLSWSKKLLYENPAAKELQLKIGKKRYFELIHYPFSIDRVLKKSSVKGIFREIGKYKFLIDVYPFTDEGVTILIRDVTRFIELEESSKIEGTIITISKLLSRIFHDMKGPIGGIKGSAQLLLEDPTDKELITDILYEVKRLENMVSEITTITKPIELYREIVNVHYLLDDIVSSFKKQYKNVQFIRSYDPSIPDIPVDIDYIRRVFVNIIRNAVEAVQGKGKVWLSTGISWDKVYSPKGDKVFIKIKDSGEGVPVDMQTKLFIPFVSTKKGGMGIGLASSYKIVKEHGGILRYVGDSTFEILLPYREEKK